MAANPGEVTATLSGLENMEELTPAICKASAEGEVANLMDIRDTRTYRVTKLKDGNCWMTQNLDYNDPNSTRITDITKWTSTSNTYRAYYDSGDTIYGNYYSFQAATNGTGSLATTDGANATGSICPEGWKLPTGKVTTSGSLGALLSGLSTTSDNALITAPYYFVRSGNVNSGKIFSAGERGYYWSSTAISANQAYYLYFRADSVNPAGDGNRYHGFSVRCLVQGS